MDIAAADPRPASAADDHVAAHAARAGVLIAVYVLALDRFGWPALIVLALAASRVGYRKRDVVVMAIPYLGWVLLGVVAWRLSAKTVTWTPRWDRPSASLYTLFSPHPDSVIEDRCEPEPVIDLDAPRPVRCRR